jgi:hypothetical protein
VNKALRKSRLAAVSLLAVTTWIVVHSIVARMCYDLYCARLGMAASMAARTGAEYLPTDPTMAVQVAHAYAKLSGILPGEIIFIRVTPDHRTLSIRLNRRMPTYIALFAVGLPSRDISVTASAQTRSDHPQAALQKTSR